MNTPELPDFDLLQDLQSFDPNVFSFADSEEKNTCALILVFACLYNDLKDLVWALDNLMTSGARPRGGRNKYNGQYYGFYYHLMKMILSLLNEFLVLIEKQETTINSQSFQDVLKTLSPSQKKAWDGITQYQDGVLANDSNKENIGIRKMLRTIRNRIGYHYAYQEVAAGEILKSFTDTFITDPSPGRATPLLSFGEHYVMNRFYFADAVIQHQLTQYPAHGETNELKELTDLIFNVIGAIVVTFIVKIKAGGLKSFPG